MLKSLFNDKIFKLDGAGIILGRNRSTGLMDLKCPRQQIEIRPKSEQTVVAKQISSKTTCINSKVHLLANEEFELNNGDILTLPGDFKFQFIQNDLKMTESISSASKDFWLKSLDLNSGLLIYRSPKFEPKSKIAGFDLDGTLIKTKSGKKFPVDENDWTFAFNESIISKKLRHLDERDFSLIVFSNQKGIERNGGVDCFKRKVEKIAEKLNVPTLWFLAMKDNLYRKPRIGMWTEFHSIFNVQPDKNDSFYVGDAAGRLEVKKERKKDHSCADRLFAINLGVEFRTPEQFFLDSKKKEQFEMPLFDPRSLFSENSLPLLQPPESKLTLEDCQEMIIFVGYPAAGKSTLAKKLKANPNYVIICQDELKTSQKCLKMAEDSLNLGKSVVIDNTSPDKESRSKFLNLVDKAKYPSCKKRCFLFNATLEQAKHNNKFRNLADLTDDKHKNVDDIVLYSFRKKFQAPTKDEGFDEIVRINLKPAFTDETLKSLYAMFLLEK
uniref:PNK FHA domain-containing protein n=1 Tax=Romanomermis culicivorax TaxID=13658 RepID=A0A915HWA7_ROMCU